MNTAIRNIHLPLGLRAQWASILKGLAYSPRAAKCDQEKWLEAASLIKNIVNPLTVDTSHAMQSAKPNPEAKYTCGVVGACSREKIPKMIAFATSIAA